MASESTTTTVIPKVMANALLGTLSAAPEDPLVETPKMGLWGDDSFTPGADDILTDYSSRVCDYGGYAAQDVVADDIVNSNSNDRGMFCSASFIGTSTNGSASRPVAHGWYIFSDTQLVCAGRFSNQDGYNLNAAGEYLDVDVVMPITAFATVG